MNEEEEQAVENIKTLEILFEIDNKKDFEATPSVQKEIAKDFNTLLNLIEKLQKENEELKEYKKIAELTKISCCTAQNCEALNNAIRERLENQKLKNTNT